MRSILGHFCWLLLAWLTLADIGAARGDEVTSGVRIAGVNLGFSGKYRVGLWTIARIKLQAEKPARGHLRAVCPDGDGVAARYRPSDDQVIVLSPGKETIVSIPIRPGRAALWLRVEWEGEGAGRIERTFAPGEIPEAVLAIQPLFVTLGSAVGVDEAVALQRRTDNITSSPVSARVDLAAELPDIWLGYEGVTALVLPTNPSAAGGDWLASMKPAQVAALERWIRLGGRAIVSVGRRGEKLLRAPASNAIETPAQLFTNLAPGRFASVVKQRTADGINAFSKATLLLELAGNSARDEEDMVDPRNDPRNLAVSVFSDITGQVLFDERGPQDLRPIVFRKAHGLGLVVFVAIDLDRPPISNWRDHHRFVARLLAELVSEQASLGDERHGSQLTNVGYTDITGQLRSALDDFPNLWTIGFLMVAVAICLYLALIGPVDYFLLRRFCPEQLETTWITYPLAVLIFCGGAWLASTWLKGDRERSNQLEVIDIDVATQPGRATITGQIWTHLYRPETHIYDLHLAPPDWEHRSSSAGGFLSFQGLPGSGFNGLHSPPTTPTIPETYDVAAEGEGGGRLRGMPIEVASTKSLYGRWWWEGKLASVSHLQKTTGNEAVGTFENPLPFELHDCHLIYNRWITTNLGTLRPGQKCEVSSASRQDDLEYKLRRRLDFQSQDTVAKWDQSEHHIARIAEVFFFHEASGGQSYTRLTNRYQPAVDLTPLVRSGRAVLWGRGPKRGARLLDGERAIGGEDDGHWIWYRVVFPVKEVNLHPNP